MSPSSQLPSQSASSSSAPQRKRSGVFEFTKKKRWGDLVTADTVEDVGFIVNRSMTVLWCGPAICEVLGWRETDLLDAEVTEYMNGMAIFLYRVPELTLGLDRGGPGKVP